ncbi:hypothetical protein [Gemmatimonas sp.]|jgi:hypothetical protein|uniref:hypothetical protein n=2 Tax=Gemmatimonas sp. TaxID=1962908 RepID=UPI00261E67D3|nr:hypothetical protein [Gemmatimonas sp.]
MKSVAHDDLASLFFVEGDTTLDLCLSCEKEVMARFALRTLRLEQSGVSVDGVLVAVCPECQRITSIPAQSEPRLRDARERAAEDRLESRVTQAAEDAFRTIAHALCAEESALRSKLVTYYLRQLQREPALLDRVRRYAEGTLARGPRMLRFAARIQHADIDPVARLLQSRGVSRSDLAIGIIGLAASDVLVDGCNSRADDLRVIAGAL